MSHSPEGSDESWSDGDDVRAYRFTNITFQVEGTLFRVPGHHFLEQSEVFRDMFTLPPGDTVPEGSSDEHPLRLEGVSRKDFIQLLRVMFPSCLVFGEVFSVPQWASVLKLCALWQMDELAGSVLEALSRVQGSQDEWVVLLDLSVEHQLPEARALAIQKITPTFRHGSEQVVMARKYGVKTWLRKGLQVLVQQGHFLSNEDGEALGLETILKLGRLREGYLTQRYASFGSRTASSWTVENQFQDELMEME